MDFEKTASTLVENWVNSQESTGMLHQEAQQALWTAFATALRAAATVPQHPVVVPKAGTVSIPGDIAAMIDGMVEFNPSKWRDGDADTWIHPPVKSAGEYVALRGNTDLGASQIRFHIRQIVAMGIAAAQAARERGGEG
jgi:hypothetical protein